MTARKFVGSISEKIRRLCGLVEKHIADHLKKNGGSDLMDLIHFHSKGNGGEGAVATTRPRAASQEALSDPSSCGSSVGTTLKANQIHHNMFKRGSELDQQSFVRFAFPEQDMIATLKLVACGHKIRSLANEMKAIRSFLSCLSSCDEQLTQAVFKVFLTNLLGELIKEEKYSAQSVSGMEPLRVDAVVSEEYMEKISKKRNWNNAVSATEKRVVLTIQSDLVVWKGALPNGLVSSAADQKKMFLNCNINVEMKKHDLLKGKMNRTALTQVAAESLARKKSLGLSRPTLYSILTDISGLYVLWHEVKKGVERDVYWVSRQETDPERFVASLYWLCLHSMDDESAAEFDSKWEEPVAATEIQEEGKDEHGSGDEGELHSIVEDEPSNHANACGAGNVDGEDEEECEDMVDVSFDDSDEDEDNEADQWSTFYAIENHRVLGTGLPLTRNLLLLHAASYSC
jgi:hypothetical protein